MWPGAGVGQWCTELTWQPGSLQGTTVPPSPRLQPPSRQGFVPVRRTQEVKGGLLAPCPTMSAPLAHGPLCPTPLLVKAS